MKLICIIGHSNDKETLEVDIDLPSCTRRRVQAVEGGGGVLEIEA